MLSGQPSDIWPQSKWEKLREKIRQNWLFQSVEQNRTSIIRLSRVNYEAIYQNSRKLKTRTLNQYLTMKLAIVHCFLTGILRCLLGQLLKLTVSVSV